MADFHPLTNQVRGRAVLEMLLEVPRECAKSHRVVLGQGRERHLTFVATNSPPAPFRCDGSNDCWAACNKVAVHAEERVVLAMGRLAKGAEIVHLKVGPANNPVPSGPPSCWQCSRLMLEAGVAGVWLFHGPGQWGADETGWRRFAAVEFHRLTLQTCGLRAGEQLHA